MPRTVSSRRLPNILLRSIPSSPLSLLPHQKSGVLKMSRLFCESPRFSVRAVMLLKTLCVLLVLVFVTAKAQFVIVRGFRDVFRNLTACSDANVDFCYEMHAESSPHDNCICRCKLLYPMFRNPDVYPSGGKYVSKMKAGCVWYANHRHGRLAAMSQIILYVYLYVYIMYIRYTLNYS